MTGLPRGLPPVDVADWTGVLLRLEAIEKEIGERVRNVRSGPTRGRPAMTQAAVAKATKMSTERLSNIERGLVTPTPEEIRNLLIWAADQVGLYQLLGDFTHD